jgi:NADH-quinone oxidoreductase subunit N
MCASAFSTTSPFNCTISRKTPCAAGCCGPKFKLKVLIFLVVVSSRGVTVCQIWNILLFMNLIFNNLYNFVFVFSSFEGFTLILLNIYIYIYLLFNLFGLFFLFDLRYLRTLNELKNCGSIVFISITLTLILISLAGVPPLLGFIGKFLLFIFLIKSSN